MAVVDLRNLSNLLATSAEVADAADAAELPRHDLVLAPTHAAAAGGRIDEEGALVGGGGAGGGVDAGTTLAVRAAAGGGFGGGGTLEFDAVHFHYPSQAVERGLQGLSFSVAPGMTTAVVGHTGAGKTTVSRLLLR